MSRFDNVLPVPPVIKPSQSPQQIKPELPQQQRVYKKPIAKSNVGVEKVSIDFLPNGEQRYTITVYSLQDRKRLPQITIRPGNHIALVLPADQPEGPFNAKK